MPGAATDDDGRVLVETYATGDLPDPETCDYCRTGRGCYQRVELYRSSSDPGDEMRLIIHCPLN